MKINYTTEMKKQDDLWKVEKENINKMFKLQESILNQALENGFNGFYTHTTEYGESTITLYINLTKEDILKEDFNFDTYYGKEMKNKNDKRTMIIGNCIGLVQELNQYFKL